MRRYEELIAVVEGLRAEVRANAKSAELNLDKVAKDLAALRVDLATHKLKSGLWGAFMGLLASLLTKLWS